MCAHLIKSVIVVIAIKRAKAPADTWRGYVQYALLFIYSAASMELTWRMSDVQLVMIIAVESYKDALAYV